MDIKLVGKVCLGCYIMKKILPILFLLFFFTHFIFAGNITIDGKAYTVDTVANFKAGPGTQYLALEFRGAKRMNVFFLKVDLNNPYITYKSALGQDSIYSGERPSAVAARKSKEGAVYFAGTNGDFYQTTGYVGYPLGVSLVESELAKTPIDWGIMAIDANKVPYAGKMTYNGNIKFGNTTHPIHHTNHLRENDQLVLYNQHNGKRTRTNSYGTEVLVQLQDGETWKTNLPVKTKVVKIEQSVGSMEIPKGFAVLSGHGAAKTILDALNAGDEVEINLNLIVNGTQIAPFVSAVGGDSRSIMLKDGIVNTVEVWNELHPRTAFGYSQDRKTAIHCVVDGRSTISAGATTKELAEIMQSAGAFDALNLDGGGSSSLFLKDFGPMNKVSDGSERAVSNGIYVVSTSPADNNIAEIKNLKQKIRLPRYGIYTPVFYGYNQYGMLISKNVTGVQLSVNPSVGEILPDGNVFVSGTQSGTVTASYNGITTTFQIELIADAPIQIRLDSVLLDDVVEYPVEVVATVEGTQMGIYPGALTWEVENPAVSSVNSGVLKGLKNGTTAVIGSLGNFKDTLALKVEIPDTKYRVAKSFTDEGWAITASTNLTNLTHAKTEAGIKTTYTYNPGRNTNIIYNNNFAFYSLPDSFKIKFNPGGTSISKLLIRFKEDNSGITSINKEYTGFAKNTVNTLQLAIPSIMDNPSDRGAYPLHFNFMQFIIDGSGMNASQQYNIDIQEFVLVFDRIQTSVRNPELLSRIHVYPNPAKNGNSKLAFSFDNAHDVKLEVISLSGKVLKTQNIGKIQSGEVQIPLEGLSSGIYFVKIYQGNNYETVKIILN